MTNTASSKDSGAEAASESSDSGRIHVVDHPLIQHKLTALRRQETPVPEFRRTLREISMLMAYEVTRDLPLTSVSIETPLTAMDAPVLIAQGTADTTVLPVSTAALVAQLSAVSATDTDPDLRSYEGVSHAGIIAASFADVVAWLGGRFAAP